MDEPTDFPRYEPERLPASRPPRAAAAGRLVGRAESVGLRKESLGQYSDQTILSFRLTDADRAQTIDVELRGQSISGSVHDGDWVEIPDVRDASGRYEVLELANLTTGAQVTVSGSLKSPAAKVTRVVFLVVFVLILIAIIVIGVQVFNGFGSDF